MIIVRIPIPSMKPVDLNEKVNLNYNAGIAATIQAEVSPSGSSTFSNMFNNFRLFASFPTDIRIAQRSGRAESLAHGFARTDHQYNDRERIGKHLQEEAPVGIVVKDVTQPEYQGWALDVQDQAT